MATSSTDLASLAHFELAHPVAEAALHAYDIGIDPDDGSHVVIASDDGIVVHASTQPDHRPSPRLYRPEIETMSTCRSIAFCPFDEMFMLIGSEDGSIRLHNTGITWAGTVDNEPILRVVWSPSRPCVFFILDTANR